MIFDNDFLKIWFHAVNASEWFQLLESFGCSSYHEYPEVESTLGLTVFRQPPTTECGRKKKE